jgi:DnaJ-class molecular chaperone
MANEILERIEFLERALYKNVTENDALESELENLSSQLCPRCGGTGEEPGQGNNPNPKACFKCRGSGFKN